MKAVSIKEQQKVPMPCLEGEGISSTTWRSKKLTLEHRRPSGSLLVKMMGGRIFRVLDWIAGGSAQDQNEDSTRRCRLPIPEDRPLQTVRRPAADRDQSADTVIVETILPFINKKAQSVKYLRESIERVLGSQRLSSGT